LKILKFYTLKTKLKFLFQLFILLVLFSCTKNQEQIVPNVSFQLYLNLDLPQFTALSSINNAVVYSNTGYNHNGVILYRNSIDEFSAFDATCPQHIETKTAIVLDDKGSGGQGTCPYCKTVYYFYNYAYPSKGYPLKRYNVSKTGNTLYVYN
jgi:hypothetical protein